MNFKKLETIHDFENLKEGDRIIVKWSDYLIKHTPGVKKLKMYEIELIKPEQQEIICELENNHYFNWEVFLERRSQAEEVYLVTDN